MERGNGAARTAALGWVLAALAAAGLGGAIAAWTDEAPLTESDRREVVQEAQRLIDDGYVLPDVAATIHAELDRELLAGAFADAATPQELADALTRVLQELTHDIHLRVTPEGAGPGGDGPQPIRVRRVVRGADGDAEPAEGDGPVRVRRVMPGGDTDADGGGGIPAGLAEMDAFPEARMLAGNVGYVRIDLFSDFPGARDKAAARMAQVAGADAVIFDLRWCRGGFPEMVHFLTSYLYPPEPRHLLTYYHANTPPESAYTFAEVPGERLADADAYILTSAFTASGGEEFTYVLKHHGRATVVGEKTAGAGHGGGMHPLPHGLSIFVPVFRPVHPVTGQGWEAVGVLPDIDVSSPLALDTAHREALRKRRTRVQDAAGRTAIDEEIARLDEALRAAPADLTGYEDYVGTYDIRTVTLGKTGLYLQRVGGPRLALLPGKEKDLFHPEIVPDGAVRFVRDDAGAVVAVEARMPGAREWMRSWRDGVAPH